LSGAPKHPTVSGLDHLVLTVRDIDQTVRFYVLALGMTHEVFTAADGTRRHALKFGEQKINLHPADGPFLPNARVAKPGSADLCFLSDVPLRDWIEHLKKLEVAIIDGPVHRSGAQGRLVSLHLRDPDGNLIELANPLMADAAGGTG